MQQLWNSTVTEWIQTNAELWQTCSNTYLFTILSPLNTDNTPAPSTHVTFFHCGYLQHRVTYWAWGNLLTGKFPGIQIYHTKCSNLDLVNRRHQLVTLSSTSATTTLSFRNSNNIPNGARYREDCRLECYSLWQKYSPALGTRRTWSSPTIALQVLSQHSVRTIPIKICNLKIYKSQFAWLNLYKRLNKNLQNDKHNVTPTKPQGHAFPRTQALHLAGWPTKKHTKDLERKLAQVKVPRTV